MGSNRKLAIGIIFVLLASAVVLLVVALLRSESGWEIVPRRPVPPTTDVPVSEQADVSPGDDFFVRLEKNEANILEKSGSPSVIREGRDLKITGSQKSLELKDCLDCGPEKDVEHYVVERFTNPDAVLVYRQLYEGDDYVLVTADGTSYSLPSYPVFSPDRKSFAVISSSEAFNWNGLEVWEAGGAGFERKLRYEPKVYELYRFLGWDGNERIRLEFSGYSAGDQGNPICRAAEIVRQNGAWKVQPLAERREGFCEFTDDWLPEYLRRYINKAEEE